MSSLVNTSISVIPDTLAFELRQNKASYAQLKITNGGAEAVAFKVKTTKPQRYAVRPNTGLVAAGGSTNLLVVLQAQKEDTPDEDYDECTDKFQMLFIIVPSDFPLANVPVLDWKNKPLKHYIRAQLSRASADAVVTSRVSEIISRKETDAIGEGGSQHAQSSYGTPVPARHSQPRMSSFPSPITDDLPLPSQIDIDQVSLSAPSDSTSLSPSSFEPQGCAAIISTPPSEEIHRQQLSGCAPIQSISGEDGQVFPTGNVDLHTKAPPMEQSDSRPVVSDHREEQLDQQEKQEEDHQQRHSPSAVSDEVPAQPDENGEEITEEEESSFNRLAQDTLELKRRHEQTLIDLASATQERERLKRALEEAVKGIKLLREEGQQMKLKFMTDAQSPMLETPNTDSHKDAARIRRRSTDMGGTTSAQSNKYTLFHILVTAVLCFLLGLYLRK